jgi:hypothetical protein
MEGQLKLPPRNRATVGLAAVALVAGVLAAVDSVTGSTLFGYSTAHAAAVTTSITVQPAAVGSALPAGFAGLSLPPAELAANDFAHTNLAAYLKTLGSTGVIRMGGNSGDRTFWTSSGERAPSWATGTITPASLRPLAAIARATGWKVILGVNFKRLDAARAADEAKNAQQIFGSSLLGIEIGNEPNYYYSDTSAYFHDFETYAAAIEKAAPGVPLVGPDPGHNDPDFLSAFVASEAARPDIAEVTNHAYPTSACNGQSATIPDLLGDGAVQDETAAATALASAARQLHVPGAMDETNSVDCGGTPGVSDVFAASLWALDYNLLLARDGVSSAEFESGISGCTTYSPLCPAGTGQLTARPLYYGLLATALVGTGNFVSVTNPDSASIRAYAVKNSSGLTVVLDDVQDPASSGPASVSLNLGADFQHGQMTVLATSSSAGLSATTGITLGGQHVSPDGSFPAPAFTPVTVTGQTATVSVNAGSAAIIKFGNGSGTTPTSTPTSTPTPASSPTPTSASTPPATPAPTSTPSATPHPAPSSAGGLGGFFGPAFLSTGTCQFSHQNFVITDGTLTTFYPAGSSSPSAGSPFGGAQICVPFAAGPQTTVALTYQVKFPVGFQFVKGGELPGVFGGVEPFSGGSHNPDGWSMRLRWGRRGSGEIQAYTANTAGYGADYGAGHFFWQADGRWHTVTEQVTVNSPGSANGSVTLTYDGRQVIDQTGIDVTNTNTPATGLYFSTFYGGHDSSWAPSADESISFAGFSASGS